MTLEIELGDYGDVTTQDTYDLIEREYLRNPGEKLMIALPYENWVVEREDEVIEEVRAHFKQQHESYSDQLAGESYMDTAKRYITKELWQPDEQEGYREQLGVGMLTALTIGATAGGMAFLAGVGMGGLIIKSYDLLNNTADRNHNKLQAYEDLSDLDIEFVYG